MTLLRSMKVGTKVLFASTILIVLTIVVALQGISSLRTASSKFDEFYSERFIPVRELNQIMRNILQIRINMLQELEAAQTNSWDNVEKRRANSKELTDEYMNLWNKFKSRDLAGKEKELADEWLALTVAPKEDRGEFVKAIDEKNMANSKQLLDHWLEGFRPLRDKTDELINLQQEKAEILQAEVKKSERQAIILGVAILALSVLTGISISIMLSRNITGQLGGEPADVMDAAGKMAEGDFTVEYSLKGNDTSSAMAAMKKMTDGLSGLITGVIFSAQNLAQAVEQISMGNQNLSQRTSEQASSLEEIASTIEEATATINQSADNADKARDLTNAGVNKSLEGNKVAIEAVSAITEMNDASKKMADIITTINEISFQTNLLALNASVEAARAGEQGRGFAVVAGEVRNLAQRSGNSAKEIEALIKDTVLKMESSTSLVENTSSSLSDIAESAQTSAQIISEIAAASQEQKQGINQINTAVSEMDKMTQQNAALVEETASASEEMANQAQELLEMVGKFKIREDLGAMDSRSEHLKHLSINSLYDENKKGMDHNRNNSNGNNGNGKHRPYENTAAFSQQAYDHDSRIDQLVKDEGFEKF